MKPALGSSSSPATVIALFPDAPTGSIVPSTEIVVADIVSFWAGSPSQGFFASGTWPGISA